jgi:hypothetical protein
MARTIRVDQGSEFVSRDLDLWASTNCVTFDFSRPSPNGKALDRYRAGNGDFVRVGRGSSGGFEADGAEERIEVIDDAEIEAIEAGLLVAV